MSKTTRWAFTAYEAQWPLFEKMPPGIGEWGWQLEKCPDTGRLHYQGYLRTVQQHRFKGEPGRFSTPNESLRNILPGVHITAAEDWIKLIQYCKKKESRVEGHEPVHQVSTFPTMYSYTEELAERLPMWDKVRELWEKHIEDTSRLLRRYQPEFKSDEEYRASKFYRYTDPTEYAYEIILKDMISSDIRAGKPVEFICQNPLFLTTWKNRIKDLIFRKDYPMEPPPSISDRQTDKIDTHQITFD